MYCPRCSQQQISDEMKFCSRCGLPLSGLAEWLAAGVAPAALQQETPVSPRSSRQKKIRRAGKLMFISGVLFPVFMVISLIIDEGGPMAVPIILFFVSFFMMLYARLFVEGTSPSKNQQTPSALGATARDALPPAGVPVYSPGNFSGQQVRTNELAQPPSVTENTTRLLDDE
jgi:hypothetical protein